jgi:hypothetical protein
MSHPLRPNQENLRCFVNRPSLPFVGSGSPDKIRHHDQSFSPSSHQSPFSVADRDRELLICSQIKKLSEMRKAQIDFFDMKMVELKEVETRINSRMENISRQDLDLKKREETIATNLKRLEMERNEISAIKELLRIENESIQVSSADLKLQLKRYERIFKLQGQPGPARIPTNDFRKS